MGLSEQQQLESTYVMHTFARKPVCLVDGQGMQVRDSEGNSYLDFIAGIGVCCLGHNAPAVVDAIVEQSQKLMHVSNYYYINGRGELSKTVSDLLNEGSPEDERVNWQSFYTNSGAESNECAMKLARLYARVKGNGGNTIITMQGSFHGRTMETLAATAQPVKQEAFEPLSPDFLPVPLNDIEALEAAFASKGSDICAIMLEPIQGESGVHPCTQEYLEAAQRIASEHGALLIFDEVQTGVYRTGRPFAFQHFGIVPDIVSIAKGIGGGFPMGMCAARADVAEVFEPGLHGTTFGGSCLAIAAATAVLDEIKRRNLSEHVDEMGAYLRSRLAEIPGVKNVRGLGLMCACDVPDCVDANSVVAAGLSNGLLLNATSSSSLRFLPPLICTREDIDALVETLPSLFVPLF